MSQPRVVTRVRIVRQRDGRYLIMAYDQGGRRFEWADDTRDTHEAATEHARDMVNKSYSPPG